MNRTVLSKSLICLFCVLCVINCQSGASQTHEIVIDKKLSLTEKDTNLSGITFNPHGNKNQGSFLVIDNLTLNIHELTTDGDHIRTINAKGFKRHPQTDWEGITYLTKEKYAIINERACELLITKIPDNQNAYTITPDQTMFYKIDSSSDNMGLEGVAYNPHTKIIYLGKERRPVQFYAVAAIKGSFESKDIPETIAITKRVFTPLNQDIKLHNIRGLAINPSTPESLFVVTAKPNMIFELDIKTSSVLRKIDIKSSNKHLETEGIAFDQNGNIAIIGESKWGKENFLKLTNT